MSTTSARRIEPDLRRPSLLINVRGEGYRLILD